MPPDPVTYRLQRTGRTEHEVGERLLTERCPTCGADWTRRGAVTPRHEGGRTYRCEACGGHHRAVQVDADRRPVTPQSWGLAQQARQRAEGPAATREG